MNYSEYVQALRKQQWKSQRKASEAGTREQEAITHQKTIRKEIKQDIGESMFEKLKRDIKESAEPMYPYQWRKKASEYHTQLQKAEIKEKRAKREKKWYQGQEEKIKSRIESLEEQREQLEEQRKKWKKTKKAAETNAMVHPGSWVKVKKEGPTKAKGISAMPPSKAKKLGYKWGTIVAKNGKLVFKPLPGKPTAGEYYGILKEKQKRGQYKDTGVEENIRREIEYGKKKYNLKAPIWAGVGKKQLKEIGKVRRKIKKSYLEAQTLTPAEPQKARKKEKHEVTEEEAKKYQKAVPKLMNLRTEAVEKHEKALKHFKGLGKKRRHVEQLTRGQKALQKYVKEKREKYKKGGWTAQEARSYNTLARQAQLMGEEIPKEQKRYKEKYSKVAEQYKQETGFSIENVPEEVKKYEERAKTFFKKYPESRQKKIQSFIEKQREAQKTKTVPPKETSQKKKKQKKKPEIELGALGKITKEKGKIPKVSVEGRKRNIGVSFSITPSAEKEGFEPEKAIKEKLRKRKQELSRIGGAIVKAQQIYGLPEFESPAAKKIPKLYHKKVTEHVSTKFAEAVGGTYRKKQKEREEAKKAKKRYKETVKRLKKSGAVEVTEEGKVIIPTKRKPEVQRQINRVEKLEKQAKSKGWMSEGKIKYPRTQEGRVWAKKYREANKQLEKHETPEGNIKSKYLEPTEEGKKLQRLLEKFKKQRKQYKQVPTSPLPAQAVKGITEFGLSLPMAPVRTARYGGRLVSQPSRVKKVPGQAKKLATSYKKMAEREPARFGAHLFGMWALSRFKGSPIRPGVRSTRYPGLKMVSIGLERVRKPGILRGGGETIYYPFVNIGKGLRRSISLGRPNLKGIPEEIYGSEGLIDIRSAYETRIAEEALGRESPKITEARATRYHTIKSGVKPRNLKPIVGETLEQHNLVKSTDVVTSLLKKQKAELYGSLMQKAAGRTLGVSALARIPRDFDARVKNPKAFAEEAVKTINMAEGREAVALKGGDEVVVKKTGEKLFDLHPKEEPVEDSEYDPSAEYLTHGIKSERLIKTKEGIKTTTLSEQATRKLQGAQQISGKPRTFKGEGEIPSVVGRVAPKHEGRVKDIADYYFAEKANIEGLRLRGKTKPAKQASTHLDMWIKSWGKDVEKYVKDLYQKQVEKAGGKKAWLGSFEKTPTSGSKARQVVSQQKYVAPFLSYRTSEISKIPSRKISYIPSIPNSTIVSRVPGTQPSRPSTSSYSVSSMIGLPSRPSRATKVSKSEVSKSYVPGSRYLSRVSKPFKSQPSKPFSIPSKVSAMKSKASKVLKISSISVGYPSKGYPSKTPSPSISPPPSIPSQFGYSPSYFPPSKPPITKSPPGRPPIKLEKEEKRPLERKFEKDLYPFLEITGIKAAKAILGIPKGGNKK